MEFSKIKMVYSLYTSIMKESTLDKGVFILNIVSPSILSADFARLADELKRIPSAQWVHFDVMDGHFVPNITVGMPVLLSVRKATMFSVSWKPSLFLLSQLSTASH